MPRVSDSATEKNKIMKLFPFVAGKTFNAHETFLGKLTKKGAKIVDSPGDRNLTIVFCPIGSRYETDLNSALESARSEIPDLQEHPVIMVAMFHTVNTHYTVPRPRDLDYPVALLVNCLFHETKGLYKCPRNKEAYNSVRNQVWREERHVVAVNKGGMGK